MAEQRLTSAEIARRTAVVQIVQFTLAVGLSLGLSWAMSNRDVLWRIRERGTRWWQDRHADPYAAEVADFQREIADINRGSSGPATAPGGLYGQDGAFAP